MDKQKLIDEIYSHVDGGHVDLAVRTCLRLSRHINDYLSSAVFLRDLIDDRDEIARVLFDDTRHLKEEAQKYVFTKSGEIWLKSRTIRGANSSDSDDDRNVFVVSVSEIPMELEQWQQAIGDLTVPSSMTPYDTAAFTDRFVRERSQIRSRILSINTIRSRVLAKCHNFAVRVEKQLEAQRNTVSFLEGAQNEVLNYFKARSEDVYEKLSKANQLIEKNSPEDFSLLLTQVRRAIKAVADHFYPPQKGTVKCVDGVDRSLGDEQYLNRLHEFVNSSFKSSTSIDLLRSELDYLMVFARKLNDVASKGVHADVSLSEAQQGYLGLYMFLYNICRRLEREAP